MSVQINVAVMGLRIAERVPERGGRAAHDIYSLGYSVWCGGTKR